MSADAAEPPRLRDLWEEQASNWVRWSRRPGHDAYWRFHRDAAALPFADGAADLVVAFMSLQDVDDMDRAIHEAARILAPGGALCLATVHPLNSAGAFRGADPEAPFVVEGSYLDTHRYSDEIERDDLPMTFHSVHRPLERYSRPLEDAGMVVEAIREVTVDDESAASRPGEARWLRIPLFLHLRARAAGGRPG